MKKLKDIIYKINLKEVIGSTQIDIRSIQFDSRKVQKNDLFIAIQGTITDGHIYINKAINQGAVAIIIEKVPAKTVKDVTYLLVENTEKSLATIACNYYQNPSKEIKLIGVTGTNGKTTVVHLLHQLYTELGIKSGMISTIQNVVDTEIFKSTHTTPDPLQINKLLSKMLDKECKYCFMEVSSHAIHQHRIRGLFFSGAIFTNITHDHLDYHKNFLDYLKTKKSFFDSLPEDSFVLTNKDDKHGLEIISNTKARKFSFSLKSNADFKCKILENQFHGMLLNINKIDVWTRLVGEFNAYNLLSVYAASILLKTNPDQTLIKLSVLNPAKGRFEIIQSNSKVIPIVDYAHTEDALTKTLNTINLIRIDSQEIITVIGCGGDRDKEKRPKMAAIACKLSNQVIFTNDNPRSEDPAQITAEMLSGLNSIQKQRTLIIHDRIEAIKTACKLARNHDIILLAGKGHEKFQEIKGKKIPFDDAKQLTKLINTNQK